VVRRAIEEIDHELPTSILRPTTLPDVAAGSGSVVTLERWVRR